MDRAVRLTIIHRNRLFRECLASVLSEDPRYQATGIDHHQPQQLAALEQQSPEVILIDASLDERLAVQLTQRFREGLPGVKLILLVTFLAEENLVDCVAAGADGCVLEDSTLDDLQTAVEKTLAGQSFCSPELVQTMFARLSQGGRTSHWRQRVESVELTPRELEIVHLIADRLSNKQIARRLSLSLYTVKNHVHNIVEKLQVEDRHEAVDYARSRHWLKKSRALGSQERAEQ